MVAVAAALSVPASRDSPRVSVVALGASPPPAIATTADLQPAQQSTVVVSEEESVAVAPAVLAPRFAGAVGGAVGAENIFVPLSRTQAHQQGEVLSAGLPRVKVLLVLLPPPFSLVSLGRPRRSRRNRRGRRRPPEPGAVLGADEHAGAGAAAELEKKKIIFFLFAAFLKPYN